MAKTQIQTTLTGQAGHVLKIRVDVGPNRPPTCRWVKWHRFARAGLVVDLIGFASPIVEDALRLDIRGVKHGQASPTRR